MTADGALILPALARAGTYVCVFVIAGAATLRVALVPALGATPGSSAARQYLTARAWRWATAAALGLLALRIGQLYGQTYVMFGQDEPVTGELMALMAGSTTWGGGWRLQTACAALAVLGAGLDRPDSRHPLGHPAIAAAAGALVIASVPLTGHAMEASTLSWPLLFQVVHVAGAAIWIGPLVMLVTVGARACDRLERDHRAPAFAALVERFSRIALGAFAVLALAGCATSLIYVGELGRLFTTPYGRALLLKLGLVLATMLVGAYNWRRVRPRLAENGAAALRSTARGEIVLASLVLGITALLVVLPMPGG